jgi:hypothetical protein
MKSERTPYTYYSYNDYYYHKITCTHLYAVINLQQYMRGGYCSRSREFHTVLLKAYGIKVVTDWRKLQCHTGRFKNNESIM